MDLIVFIVFWDLWRRWGRGHWTWQETCKEKRLECSVIGHEGGKALKIEEVQRRQKKKRKNEIMKKEPWIWFWMAGCISLIALVFGFCLLYLEWEGSLVTERRKVDHDRIRGLFHWKGDVLSTLPWCTNFTFWEVPHQVVTLPSTRRNAEHICE